MAYLLDTNVISELRKKGRCDPKVAAWQSKTPLSDCFVSTISMMEIRIGVMRARKTNAPFAKTLEDWYEQKVKPGFSGRVIPVSLAVAEQCGWLMNLRTRELADGLIAATAQVHGLVLVTRNTADFADTGVHLIDPWA